MFSFRNFRVVPVVLALLFAAAGFAQQRIKVACVGNSITAGYGVKKGEDYPAQLQQLLGTGYEVSNYGVSSRTLLSKGDYPYIKEKKYADALASNPDIVIIKLGTNDSKPQNWQYKNEFVADYIKLVKSFQQLPSKPRIFICYPLPVFKEVTGFHPEWKISNDTVYNKIIPMVKKVRRKTKVNLINLYKPFKDKPDLLYDGIHPSAKGDSLIAAEVFKAIKD